MERRRTPSASTQRMRFQRVPIVETVSDYSSQSLSSVSDYGDRSREYKIRDYSFQSSPSVSDFGDRSREYKIRDYSFQSSSSVSDFGDRSREHKIRDFSFQSSSSVSDYGGRSREYKARDNSRQSSSSVSDYGDRSREYNMHHLQRELEPVEYAWLIKQEFASSLKYKKKWSLSRKSRLSRGGSDMIIGEKSSKKKPMDLSDLQHLDLATRLGSSRHSIVDEVINEVLARALKTADLSRLQQIGVPPKYLPTIAEAMQAEHLSELKHLDLANNGSFGQKRLELRRLVETRLPTFLSCNILA